MSSKPRVYAISRPILDQQGLQRFLEDESLAFERTADASPAEEITEIAGRVCYMSFGQHPKRNRTSQYVANLIGQGHESVLEHVSWSLIVTGLTRACTHQLVRHRIGFAFSQLSQQYHDETNAEFLKPDTIEQFPATKKAWAKCEIAIRETYRTIVDELSKRKDVVASSLWAEGQPVDDDQRLREILRFIRATARSLLPNATETKIVVSANARALRHFFTIRGEIWGDEEMRRLATEIYKVVCRDAPSLFADFSITTLPDGSPQLIKEEH